MATPSVEDIDNDGMNEIAAVTREGFVFVWDTDGKPSDKPTWMTDGHDNFSSSNSKTDATPPASVTSIRNVQGGIEFKSPGDNGFFGRAKEIFIYGSTEPVTTDTIGNAVLLKAIVPGEGGKDVFVRLEKDYPHYVVIAKDKAGNSSQLPLPASKPVNPEEGGGSSKSGGWCFVKSGEL